jgi:hypothetical protein
MASLRHSKVHIFADEGHGTVKDIDHGVNNRVQTTTNAVRKSAQARFKENPGAAAETASNPWPVKCPCACRLEKDALDRAPH